MQKLQIQSNGHSEKLDKIIEDLISINCHAPTNIITSTEAEMLAKERTAWAASQKEANTTILQLKEETTQLKALLSASSQEGEHSNLQLLKNENARLQTVILSASQASDASIQELKRENIKLKAQLQSSDEKTKNFILELEAKLEMYQSKCAQAESSLNQVKSLVSEKDQQISYFQERVQMLEVKSSQANSLADALQLQLNNSEMESREHLEEAQQQIHVEEQVKTIMNKVYKETMKQFQPEETYSFKTIKSTVSAVIRVRNPFFCFRYYHFINLNVIVIILPLFVHRMLLWQY